MDTLANIKADMVKARKARDPIASTLITLAGEIQSKEKSFSPARAISDDEVVAVVKKFLKGTDETIRLLTGAGKPEALDFANLEKTALEAYLPSQMSEDDLTAFAKEKAAEGANMGQIMGALKAERPGQYDGRMASGIVKSVLG